MPGALDLWNKQKSGNSGGIKLGKSPSGSLSAADIWASRNDSKLRGKINNYYQDIDEEKKKLIRKALEKRIDTGLNEGMAWEDISKQTGIELDKIKNYSQKSRPNYGVKPPGAPLLEQGGDFGQAVIDRVGGGIVRGGGRLGALLSEQMYGQQGQRKAVEDFIGKYSENSQPSSTNPFGYNEASVGGRTGRVIGTGISAGVQAVGIGKAEGAARGLLPGASKTAQAARFLTGSLAGTGGSSIATTAQGNKVNLPKEVGVGLGVDLLTRGGGKLLQIRKARQLGSPRKVTKLAGDVSSEVKTALSKVDNPELSLQLQATFGSKTKRQIEAIAKRSGVQTSRTKQFLNQAERDIVDQIEADPDIVRSGQLQTQADTLAAALERGPMNLDSIKVGQKVDAIDVARARMSMSPYLDEYTKAVRSGDNSKLEKTYESLAKAKEGYQIVTGEAGRALNIQNTFDDSVLKTFDTLADYQQTLSSGQPLTNGQKDILNTMLDDLTDQAELTRIDGAKNAIYAGDKSIVRKLEEYATAAKLTSPVTHLRNIVGNTLTFGGRAIEQSTATGIGALRGRTSLRAAPRVLGTVNGYKTATSKFVESMKDALTLRQGGDVSDGLMAREGYNTAINGRFGEFVRLPFKFLEAADEFGKTILRDSRINQEAFDLAHKEGFRGEDLINRVDELVRAPTKPMLKAAEADALEHTFQKPLGKVGSATQKVIAKIPGGKFFVPFLRTPTNIVKFQLNRSLPGAPGQVLKAVSKKGTREGDEALARAFIGTAASLGTFNWVKDHSDSITGAAPKSSAERDAFYAEGKQPFSVKVGDRWVSYQNFQPVGLYLLQAKSLADAIDKEDNKSAVKIASAMAQTASQGVLELPFVQGLNNVFEALANPEYKAEDFVASFAKGFIPNGLRDIRLYTDAVVRAPKNLREQVMDMLPGLSKTLEPRKTILNEDATRKDAPLQRSLLRLFGTKSQPTSREYKAIKEVAEKTGYSPGTPFKTQRDKELTDQEYSRYQSLYYKQFKKNLSKVVATNSFKSASADTKKEVIQKLVTLSGTQAKDEMFGRTSNSYTPKKSTGIIRESGL